MPLIYIDVKTVMKYLAEKVVLITDLDPAIGTEVADRLLHAGASVLVTGFRAAEVISKRFEMREGITYIGFERVTADGILELYSRIQQDHGGLDVIFTNNDVCPDLGADEILFKHAIGFSFTLQKLHPLLRNGSAIVVCASFPPEQRRQSKVTIDAASAFMQSSAQYWALALEARRIRVNVVSLYKPDRALESEHFDLSVAGGKRPKVQTRANTINEIASAVADLVDEDCLVSGAEVTIESGQTQINQLPPPAESMILGNVAQVVENVIFLASDLSRPLTGIELFPEGEIRKL